MRGGKAMGKHCPRCPLCHLHRLVDLLVGQRVAEEGKRPVELEPFVQYVVTP